MTHDRRRRFGATSALTLAALLPLPARSESPKPDLACTLQGWGLRDRAVTDGGSVPGLLEPDGQRGLEFALTVHNGGGAAAGAFKVRYDEVIRIGSKATEVSRPLEDVPGLKAGQAHTTPRRKVTAPGPASIEITATVDAEGSVAESNEGNNVCKLTVDLR